MRLRWIATVALSGVLATSLPAAAQQPAPATAAAGSAAANRPTSGDPNVSYPLANGGTYQGPLTGQAGPTEEFYKDYSRT